MLKSQTRRAFNLGLLAGSAGLAIPTVARAATTLVLSHHLPTGHIVHRTSERFAALVKQATNGDVTVDVHPNAQLFNERSGIEALRLGTLDLCWGGLATLGNWRPEFGFLALPFIMTGFDHVKKVIYGPVGDKARADALKTLGIDVLSLGASGFRIFMGNKRIQTADDCKGIKLRVPEIPVYVEMARALGANATPIPADAIYTSLQTHVVDEMENPPDYMVDVKLWEVAKNATQTNHIFTDPNLMSSAAKISSLPPAAQRAVHAAAHQAVQVEMWTENLNNQRQAWTVIAAKCQAIGNPDRKSFQDKTKSVITDFIAKNGAPAKAYLDGVAAAAG